MSTTNNLSLERFLVAVGAIPMAIEPYLPTALRRNFGVRLFALAALVIVVAPGIAIVAISDVVVAALFFSAATAVTGFLGYCEMYRALRLINGRVLAVQDGEFDIDFGEDRIDEIGETFDGFERMAGSLGETLEEAEVAKRDAEDAKQEAEQARETAENEREEVAALTDHLEAKADAYRSTLAAAADGDLTARVDPESQSDAMAAVGTGINETLDALEAAVGRSQQVASEIAEESATAADRGDAATETTDSVVTSVQEIAEGTDDQRRQLGEAADQMSTLSATVEEMASSVTELANRSDAAADLGRDARSSTSDAADALTSIEQQVDSAADQIAQLSEISEEVADIVELIDQIAEETNTLALNASIEAARAGEAGEGFAVVANEVKSLAEETQAATDEVEDLVDSMQSQVDDSVAEMTTTQTAVGRGSETISETIGTIEDVVEETVQINTGIQEIDNAADQQAQSAQEVVTLIDDVSDIAAHTATEAEQIATDVDRQREAVDDVTDSVRSFADETTRLREYLGTFETETGRERVVASAD